MSQSEAQTQARSRLYGLLGRAFAFPEGALYRDLTGGVWQSAVVETLPFSVGPTDLNLAFREAQAVGGGGDRGFFLRAQGDFLERHLVRFLAALAKKVRDQDPPPFYQALAEMGHRFTREDHACVTAALASL